MILSITNLFGVFLGAKSSVSSERLMDRTLKAVYVWIVLALIWMGLELLLYGEIQPRTVDDIM